MIESTVDTVDAAAVEAAMVLLGTDPERILTAVGLHLHALDVGELVLTAERVHHGGPDRTSVAELHRRAGEWWLLWRQRLPSVATRARQAALSDPRVALPELVGEIREAVAVPLGDTTATLLAVCVIARHGLDEVAEAAVRRQP